MSLRFICIELRKNLRCANVFLHFDQSLTETEFLKIQVDADAIRLKEYSTETCISVQQYFAIEARTMSSLVVEECNASFRITIDEIPEHNDATATESESADYQKKPTSVETLKPLLRTDEVVALHCRNCKGALMEQQQQFQRILEFPSGTIDVSEFFCHHGPEFGQSLVPQMHDLFYGFQFLVLNARLLYAKIKEKEMHLYCRRCLCYLGETLLAGKAAKLWSDSLLLLQQKTTKSNESANLCDLYEQTLPPPTAQLLHKIICETSLNDNESLLHDLQFSKVLLEATFPSRQRRHLLLHILEKQLEILRNVQPLAHGSIHNNNNALQVKLQKCKCFKLLYRLIDDEVDDDDESSAQQQAKTRRSGMPLLDYWKQDISIHSINISPKLFSDLLFELDENSLLLPEQYRHSNENFQLSYIFYES